jgi:hypothetical protein
VTSASSGSAVGSLAARMATCRCDFARACAKPAHFPHSAAFYKQKAPPLACAPHCIHQGLPLACKGGCAWSSGAVGGPFWAHRRPQGRFRPANCQNCTAAVKNTQRAPSHDSARLRSPWHTPGLTSGLQRWLQTVKRRSRRSFLGAQTPARTISPCQLPKLQLQRKTRREHRRTTLLACARHGTHQGLPLACEGGCARSSGAVGGPFPGAQTPAGTISPCQLPKLQKIGEKHAQSTAACLRSPWRTPGLDSGLQRWLRMVKRRSRWFFLSA